MQDTVSLYQQVRDDYKRLFPGQRAILALVYLYEQFGPTHAGGQVFTDDDLTEAMHRVASDEPAAVEEVATRTSHQQWRYLQQHLLERDRDTQTYRFTVFGLTLCQGLQKVFTEQVNPTQVAQTFATLRRSLQDEDLLHWVQTVLPELRGVIQQHVETLAENLRIELRRLRRRADHDEALNSLVRRVSETLGELSQQAAELRSAFGQATELDAELEKRWQDLEESDAETEAQLRNGIVQARDFLEHTHQRLRTLERRLSLVQPRIRDLFGNLRKLQFDRNSERLLDAFLHPDLLPGTWPAGIQPKSPGLEAQSYCLMSGRSERALPPQPAPARSRPFQPEAEAAFGRQTQAQWDVQQRVSYWLRELTQAVAAHANDGFPFIELVHRIGQAEGANSFPILARLLAQLRRHVAPRRGWTLEPDPATEEHLTIPAYTLTLWKLRIRPAPKS